MTASSAVTTIGASGDLPEEQAIHVEHKRSKVSYRPGENSTEDLASLELYQHQKDFGIQGKRLRHIEMVDGRKLYVGIKTIDTAETLESSEKSKIEEEGSISDLSGNKFTDYRGTLDAMGDMSTFEISTSYIENDLPDLLDMYRLKDDNYGIRIANEGGEGESRNIKISWSPLMHQDDQESGA